MIRILAALGLGLALIGGARVFAALPELQDVADPRRSALTVADLPPGFRAVADRTKYDERPDGVAVYETVFIRDRTPANLTSGPVEVRNGVARTASLDDAARQLAVSSDAFIAAGWTAVAVPPLGEESVGLSQVTEEDGVRSAAHVYLFRQGPWVLLVGVLGRPEATSLEHAVALAIVVSDRIHVALAGGQPGPAESSGVAPRPTAAVERVRVVNVGGGSANVRLEPSTSATILTQVPEGTVLEVAGPDREAGERRWRNVRLADGRAGWIAAELLAAAPLP